MALWGREDRANNAPKWKSVATGSSIPHRGARIDGLPVGLTSGTGNITIATTTTTVVTGTLTDFSNQLQVGSSLYNNQNVFIGVVNNIASATSLNLVANALVAVASANTYRFGFSNNLWNNTTSGAFINNISTGVFGIGSGDNSANAFFRRSAQGIQPRQIAPGWNYITQGTGPVTSATVTGGTNFRTGGTVSVSNGTSNAVLTLTANTQGNLASAAVTVGGSGFIAPLIGNGVITTSLTSTTVTGTNTNFSASFVGDQLYVSSSNALIGTIASVASNTSITLVANALVAVTSNAYEFSLQTFGFNAEKWANNIANTTNGVGAGAFNTATVNGYSNGNIVTVSNSVANGTLHVQTAATFNVTSTNSTGGNFTLVLVSPGVFGNTLNNNQVTYTVTNGTGSAPTAVNTAIFGNTHLISPTSASSAYVTNLTLGGRAGRILRETLAYVRNMANNAASGGGSVPPA